MPHSSNDDQQLDQQLKEIPPDVNGVKSLINLTREYLFSEPNKALKISQHASEIAWSIGDELGLANSYHLQSIALDALSLFNEAITRAFQALNLFHKIGQVRGECDVSIALGIFFCRQGNYPEALEYYFNCYHLSKRFFNKIDHSAVLNNIGLVYYETGDYDNAKKYLTESLELCSNEEDLQRKADTLNNLGLVALKNNQLNNAEQLFTECLKLQEKMANKFAQYACITNLGIVCRKKREFDRAFSYFEKVLTFCETYPENHLRPILSHEFGEYHRARGDHQTAREWFEKALDQANELNLTPQMVESFEALVNFYKEIGDFEKAFIYQEQLYQIRYEHSKNKTQINTKQQLLNLLQEKSLSESKLRAVFDHTDQSLLLIGRDYTIQIYNRRAEDWCLNLFGRPIQEMTSIFDLIDVKTRDDFLRDFERVWEGESIKFERHVRFPNHSPRWMEYSLTPIQAERDEVNGFLIGFLDINERKEKELQLLQLSRAVEQSPVSVVIMDTSGKIEYVNPMFTKVTGYSSDEVVGQNHWMLKTNHLSKLDYEKLWDTITSGENWRGEFQNRQKSGQEYWEIASISSIRNISGEITHYIKVAEDITELKQTQLRLHEQEQLLSRIASATTNIIYCFDLKTRHNIYQNKSTLEYLGYHYSPEEITRDLQLMIIHPEDVSKLDQLSEQIPTMRDDEINEIEFRLRHSDNRWRWFRRKTVVFERDRDGLVTKIVSSLDDITERRQAEDLLIKEKELFSEGPVISIIWAIEQNWPVIYVSKNLKNVLGYEPAEWCDPGFAYAEIIHPDDLSRVVEEVNRSIITKTDVYEQEYRLRRKDGVYVYIYDFTRLDRDPVGNLIDIRGYIFDQTDRMRAKILLAAEKELLRVTLISIGDGVIATDIDGRISLINHVTEKLTGWNQTEAIGQHINNVYRILEELPDHAFNDANDQVFTGQKMETGSGTILLQSRDGSIRPIAENVAPIRDINGQIIGLVIVFRDMTEARRLEKAKSTFMSAISHELRTPLAPILGYTELLLENEFPRETQRTMLNEIIQAANRENIIIDELLTVARLESDQELFQFETYNMSDLSNFFVSLVDNSIRQMVSKRHGNADYKFTHSFGPDLKAAEVRIDLARIQQILDNLVSNAVKYSEENRLAFTFSCQIYNSTCIRISLGDEGIGIPASETEHIFKPFYQIRSTPLSVSDGIGQGLFISKHYVEAHGGHIGMERKVVGSEFWFTIPLISQLGK